MKRVAVVGGGPAGLMAAEVLSGNGFAVDLYHSMPS
ncbi:MAG TPA: NAD(P)/FAD-dependent oxidoreductase, partial [Rhodocyclaceae bacterium]|nr:NAD(P)/FAD-dependent oxidoreductase [Rhodocyclaceae bacterium]